MSKNTVKTTEPIVFCIGEETKPVILDKSNYKQSLFASQIESAIAQIRAKTPADKIPKSGQNTLQQQKNKERHFNDVYDNNIISFVGERGSGKSSCMYSVVNVLREEDEIESSKYCFLGAIDPSFFDANHNIMQLIIGKMYASFCEELKKLYRYVSEETSDFGYGKDGSDSVYTLKKAFLYAKKHLKYLDAKPQYENEDELEELDQLSAGIDLRSSLSNLISVYLKFMNNEMLVITIDDIDLNTEQAYEMTEQIRRFLILPNVVILMAVKIDQLADVIRLKLTEQYKSLLSDKRMSDERIAEMATRYLSKLLPLDSRIYMPDLDVYMNTPLVIVEADKANSKKFDSIKMAVPELIFIKCRYLFYNTQGTTSPIVPRNLRDLRLLVSMLFRMPDYNATCSNKTVFKKYFFESWLNSLDTESRSIARSLIAIDEPTQLNKNVVQALSRKYGLYSLNNSDIRDWKIILDNNVVTYNLSIGDAFAVIDYVKQVNADADTQRLIFFIKSLYSIRLYEYYDRQTDSIDVPEELEEVRNNKPNRHDDFLDNISDYRKLIGGSFFNIKANTLLPQEGRDDEKNVNSREMFTINKNSLTKLINKIKSEYTDISGKSDEVKAVFTDNLMTAEFLMLTISRYIPKGNVLSEVSSDLYRNRMEAYYDRNLQQVQNVVFDVTTPFFTLTDVCHAYGRFDSEIFEIASNWKMTDDGAVVKYQSLYNRMLSLSNYDAERRIEHNFLSRVGIRNSEVADDLLRYLESKRDKYRPGVKGIVGILSNFYDNIAKYFIATYDRWTESKDESKKDGYYEIRFKPFRAIAEFLESTSNDILTEILTVRGRVASSQFEYINRDMTRDEIWTVLSDNITDLTEGHKIKLFNGTFKKENERYTAYEIRQRLQNLTTKNAWTVLTSLSDNETNVAGRAENVRESELEVEGV